ncbi:unnamed protein product [Lactuca saligna]|uniref:Uncharacterized protein n=1 Tax=Lactuca saligna TaxID=75948 RepID=A0AA35Z566_LACSI|nr:unnamed protein product [Lactuca saligna]
MVLGQEVISWLDGNEALHHENRGLRDVFNRVTDLVKPFVTLSGGVSHNVQVYCDHYMDLVEKVAKFKKVSITTGSQIEKGNENDMIVYKKSPGSLLGSPTQNLGR